MPILRQQKKFSVVYNEQVPLSSCNSSIDRNEQKSLDPKSMIERYIKERKKSIWKRLTTPNLYSGVKLDSIRIVVNQNN